MAIKIETISIGYGVPCPNCLYAFAPLSEVTRTFFETGSVLCRRCGTSCSLWDAALRHVRKSEGTFFGVSTLGASVTSFLFDLSAGEHKELDLSFYGVPPNATILDLTFTSQGGDCFAQVKHGNRAMARFLGPKVQVFGMPHAVGVAGGKTCAGVTWIEEKDSAESWLYLIDAFEAMASRKYRHVVISAHAGFEISLTPFLRDALEAYISKERARDYFDAGPGVSSALNVILPLICEILNVRQLDGQIRGQLNRLRELRNKLVHEGVPKEAIDERVAAELLTASMFGFEYVQFLRSIVTEKRKGPGPAA